MPLKNKTQYNAYNRAYYKKKKQAEILKKGGKCENCGEANIELLSIAKRKKPIPKTMVLCWNCRHLKGSLNNQKVESKK